MGITRSRQQVEEISDEIASFMEKNKEMLSLRIDAIADLCRPRTEDQSIQKETIIRSCAYHVLEIIKQVEEHFIKRSEVKEICITIFQIFWARLNNHPDIQVWFKHYHQDVEKLVLKTYQKEKRRQEEEKMCHIF